MDEPATKEEQIFERARFLTDPAARSAYIGSACKGNRRLQARVEELLAAYAEADSFFNGGVAAMTETPLFLPAAEQAGDQIGEFKLLQKMGEGGCGVVYMAEQHGPVRRRVALKIIKLGMDTRQAVARFEAERQTLAMLDHPNIAKVFHAGATETGRPFFAMELVRGVRMTEYCDQHCLTARERLELFLKVCQAVQHAHQKGIIHRDLKPSNILVTIHDGVALPKVIDFGIAKAVQGKLTDQTLFTAFKQLLGTPAYMSPEQALMTSVDVDTRSDIYSLGVLLYELLTGKTPFDTEELLALGLDELGRTIREKEPVRPSTRLEKLEGNELTRTAQRRRCEGPRLISVLRGDVDWIVMKCLEKDRSRRYETASALARDIERYLNNEPVTARPAGSIYRLRKLIRRNTGAFAGGAALLVVILLAGVFSSIEAVRARRAEREQNRLLIETERARAKELQSHARAQEETMRARAAEAAMREKLWESYLSQAEAGRWSRKPGRRFAALELLRKAAAIRPSLELRNKAIASL